METLEVMARMQKGSGVMTLCRNMKYNEMYPDSGGALLAVEVGEASLCGAGGISMTWYSSDTCLLAPAPDLPTRKSRQMKDQR